MTADDHDQHPRYPQGFATPGAVQQITTSPVRGPTIRSSTSWRSTFRTMARHQKLTLNLGLRWDANIGLLPDQTNNRTIQILNSSTIRSRKRSPANLKTSDHPEWKEYQPRLGFAWDPTGRRSVIRGGYGIFYDQIFQNLTMFSLSQTDPVLYSDDSESDELGRRVGQFPTFRFGVDPLPTPPPFRSRICREGLSGASTIPDMSDPYVQKFSIGTRERSKATGLPSSDYVHTRGYTKRASGDQSAHPRTSATRRIRARLPRRDPRGVVAASTRI